jgi:hypothetical protein
MRTRGAALGKDQDIIKRHAKIDVLLDDVGVG